MTWDPPAPYDTASSDFLDFILEHGITQFVNYPTHRAGNILDLVMGSDEFFVNNLCVDAPLLVDHFSVIFSLKFFLTSNSGVRTIKQYDKSSDLSVFLDFLNWDTIFDSCQTWKISGVSLKMLYFMELILKFR